MSQDGSEGLSGSSRRQEGFSGTLPPINETTPAVYTDSKDPLLLGSPTSETNEEKDRKDVSAGSKTRLGRLRALSVRFAPSKDRNGPDGQEEVPLKRVTTAEQIKAPGSSNRRRKSSVIAAATAFSNIEAGPGFVNTAAISLAKIPMPSTVLDNFLPYFEQDIGEEDVHHDHIPTPAAEVEFSREHNHHEVHIRQWQRFRLLFKSYAKMALDYVLTPMVGIVI